MNKLTQRLIGISRVWWQFLLVLALNMASFTILFALDDRFEALTEIPVFDVQNNLTAETLRAQLPLYVGEARDAYLAFAAFDFVFPFISALFLAVLWALLLRVNRAALSQTLLRWNFPLLIFLVTLFDYGENIALLTILFAGAPPLAVDAALLFKALKLNGLAISGMISIALLGFALAHWAYRWWQTRSAAQLPRTP
jgi:hypothetical protein